MASVAFYVDGQQGKNYPVSYYGVWIAMCLFVHGVMDCTTQHHHWMII